MLLTLQTLENCPLKVLNFHLVYDTLTFMYNLNKKENLECIAYYW